MFINVMLIKKNM